MKRRRTLRQMRRRSAARREIAKGFALAFCGLLILVSVLASPILADVGATCFPIPYHGRAAQ